ncbi:hypothetical protein H6P81_018292 [Aristolochia fimbriata]|uniref:Uncharacterized protein n=1 Tax=Aristolochia fimbriata TaxID=158543 RepID=A0AAV7E1E0_ARIFI|nr:hypothetical protein H6P81_018292 [Aristolochia fimbriata]
MDDGLGMTQIGCDSRMPDIHPPEISKTKGSGKRLKGEKEKAVEQSNKIKRLCEGCNELANHDKRNCPMLKKSEASISVDDCPLLESQTSSANASNVTANYCALTLLKVGSKKERAILGFHDGITAEEKASKEPEEAESMQMTDVVCPRCTERKVGVADIIQHKTVGVHCMRQLMVCFPRCYFIVDTSAVKNDGMAPWATDKFEKSSEEDAESPRFRKTNH